MPAEGDAPNAEKPSTPRAAEAGSTGIENGSERGAEAAPKAANASGGRDADADVDVGAPKRPAASNADWLPAAGANALLPNAEEARGGCCDCDA